MRTPTEAVLLRPEPSDEARAAPKFDHAIIEKRLGLFDGFAIIAANDSSEVFKMFVESDEIGSVIYHGAAPWDQAGAQHSQSPVTAEGGAVMGTCSHVRWSALWSIAHLAKSLTVKLVRFQKGPLQKSKGTTP